jgi:hypothetical protein
MNIVEPILFQCKLNPLALAIYVPGSKYGAINYATLERYIHNVAQTALKSGIAARNVVAIYVADPILHTSLWCRKKQTYAAPSSCPLWVNRGHRITRSLNSLFVDFRHGADLRLYRARLLVAICAPC